MAEAGPGASGNKSMKVLGAIVFTAVLAMLVLIGWLQDFVTISGARTVYTVECAGGRWEGLRCGGHLAASHRYRLKVLKRRGEVLYWIAGSPSASQKLTPCVIENAKNWDCTQAPGAADAPVRAMKHGQPIVSPEPLRAIHSVAKWKWLLAERGLHVFRESDG